MCRKKTKRSLSKEKILLDICDDNGSDHFSEYSLHRKRSIESNRYVPIEKKEDAISWGRWNQRPCS